MTDNSTDKKKEVASFSFTDRRHWVQEDTAASGDTVDLDRLPTMVEKLKQEAEEKDKRLREYIAAYKAKTSETDEFRQRLQKDNEARLDQAKAGFFAKIVPILDNLKRASSAAKSSVDFDSLHSGIELIIAQFTRELQEQGVEAISAKGRKFNPATDEVFMTVPTADSGQDNEVVEDLEPGYKFKDKLIKPVKVKIARLENKS